MYETTMFRSLACYVLAPLLVASVAPADAVEQAQSLIPSYGAPRLACRLENSAITESSGLARSELNAGVYWTHNDSGGAPALYAFDMTGRDLGTWRVAGVKNSDWEDIAAFALGGKHYIAVADTGDNEALSSYGKRGRGGCIIYFVEEPTVAADALRAKARAQLKAVLRFTYEDGPHDCEALAVDAREGAVYLLTKTYATGGGLYRLALPKMDGKTTEHVARKIASTVIPLVTGMDVSRDGTRVVILCYLGAAQFERSAEMPWQQVFAKTSPWAKLTVPGQFEAVAFGSDDATLVVTSEITKRSDGNAPVYVLTPMDPKDTKDTNAQPEATSGE